MFYKKLREILHRDYRDYREMKETKERFERNVERGLKEMSKVG